MPSLPASSMFFPTAPRPQRPNGPTTKMDRLSSLREGATEWSSLLKSIRFNQLSVTGNHFGEGGLWWFWVMMDLSLEGVVACCC